jgi:hypothetical protein
MATSELGDIAHQSQRPRGIGTIVKQLWQRRWFHWHGAIDLFWAFFIFGALYRVRLASGLLAGHGPKTQGDLRELLAYTIWELGLAAAIVLALLSLYSVGYLLRRLAASLISDRRAPSGALIALPRAGGRLMLLGCTLFCFWAAGSIYHTHFTALFVMHTGLTYELYLEGVSGGFFESMVTFAKTTELSEKVIIAAPLLLFVTLRFTPKRARRWRDGALAALAGIGFVVTLPAVLFSNQAHPPLVTQSPVYFLARDAVRSFNRAPPRLDPLPVVRLASTGAKQPGNRAKLPFEAQLTSVSFIHPIFVNGVKPRLLDKVRAEASKQRWNLVIVLMESVGAQYVERKFRGKYAMPFLRSLAKNGWSARSHFSPSNSSPRSIFSLFSGLYPMPELRIFAMRSGLRYPSLFTFLGRSYRSILVTPASIHWYFPRHYFIDRGPEELLDYNALTFAKKSPHSRYVRDERQVVDYFLNRLRLFGDRPFAAVYYTFAGHWPYPDFGPKTHRFPPWGKLNRYLNNLYLIDRQIGRIVRQLETNKQLERTIMVFVGDHGEAFGQHPGNWTHSRHSFNENYQTPLVLYQPRLFKARTLRTASSHIDLLPTLLDAMGIRYNARLLQGESLFQDVFRRKYIFLYGNEDTISSISRAGVKLQISFKHQRCWAYDLAHDPHEQKRLACRRFAEQHRATRLYHRFQTQTLRRYNRALRKNEPFFGQKH